MLSNIRASLPVQMVLFIGIGMEIGYSDLRFSWLSSGIPGTIKEEDVTLTHDPFLRRFSTNDY